MERQKTFQVERPYKFTQPVFKQYQRDLTVSFKMRGVSAFMSLNARISHINKSFLTGNNT
jgi:hypothetical protein